MAVPGLCRLKGMRAGASWHFSRQRALRPSWTRSMMHCLRGELSCRAQCADERNVALTSFPGETPSQPEGACHL